MQLSEADLVKELESGELVIVGPNPDFPFDPVTQIQPASVDLRLDPLITKFAADLKFFDVDIHLKNVRDHLVTEQVKPGDQIIVPPNGIVFGQIYEQLRIPPNTSARVVGRSRIARLGLAVHCTGSYINPEFEGAMPLQIVNHNSFTVALYPYMTVCQLVLYRLSGDVIRPYPSRSDNPYHRERHAGPSVAHRDEAIAPDDGFDITKHRERHQFERHLEVLRQRLQRQHLGGPIVPEETKQPSQQTTTYVFQQSQIGSLNTGEVLGNITSTIVALRQDTNTRAVGQGLEEVMNAVNTNRAAFSEAAYLETLEQLQELSKQAALPVDQRGPKGVVKALMGGITSSLSVAAAASDVWDKWSGPIRTFFGI